MSLTVKPVGKPDARNGHVRFDERGWETGRCFGTRTRACPRLYPDSEVKGLHRLKACATRGQGLRQTSSIPKNLRLRPSLARWRAHTKLEWPAATVSIVELRLTAAGPCSSGCEIRRSGGASAACAGSKPTLLAKRLGLERTALFNRFRYLSEGGVEPFLCSFQVPRLL